jgi:hypothetical protein
MRQYISNKELDDIEKCLDDGFESSRLPSEELYGARWALCVAGEDAHRVLVIKKAAECLGRNSREVQSGLIARLDRYKYELKLSFDLCERKLPQGRTSGIRLVDEGSYTLASDLPNEASDNFLYAINAFTSVRSGGAKFYRLPDGAVAVERPVFQPAYRALEMLVGADQEREGLNPLSVVILALAGPKVAIPDHDSAYEWAPEIWDIVRRSRVSRNRVKYQFITNLGRALLQSFVSECAIIPERWEFPWGGREDLQLFFQALQARCLYHLLSVHFGALQASLPGLAYNQICLGTLKTALVDDIARIAELKAKMVVEILEALTLGSFVRSPDPALQPIIPVGPQEVAVPSFVVLSSNWERNLLSLHARVSPHTFDRSSNVFELKMVSDLAAEVPKYFLVRKNFWLRSRAGSEEIDFILVDTKNFSILICELRWMLQPGDAREVVTKADACREKVRQAQRKLISARSEANALLDSLNLDRGAVWAINAAVVLNGWSGIPSSMPNEIPIVPMPVLIALCGMVSDLDRIHAILCSPYWLPREGVDFKRVIDEREPWGIKLSAELLMMGSTSFLKENLPKYVRELTSKTPFELRSASWLRM